MRMNRLFKEKRASRVRLPGWPGRERDYRTAREKVHVEEMTYVWDGATTRKSRSRTALCGGLLECP